MIAAPAAPFVVALAAQAQGVEQTERAVTAVIVILLVVAALLSVLTVWYAVQTSPRRAARRAREAASIDVDRRAPTAPPVPAEHRVPQHIEHRRPVHGAAGPGGDGWR